MTNIPALNLPYLNVNGLVISNNATTPNTKVDVTAGQVRAGTLTSPNIIDLIISSATTIDATVRGAGGLDTGSLAASSWYAVHVIGSTENLAQPSLMFSLSETAPTLPRNYDNFVRIGWVKTDSSSHFLAFKQYGNSKLRQYYWQIDATAGAVLVGGNQTSFTDVTSLPNLVAPTARIANLWAAYTPATANNKASLRINGSAIAAANCIVRVNGQVNSVLINQEITIDVDSSRLIEYVVANGSDALTLYCRGFVDFI